MSQIGTRSVTLNSVARSPAFREGFNDYMNGKPPQFDRDWERDRRKSPTDKAWAYERGRIFAAWISSKGMRKDDLGPWFINKRLSWSVLSAVSDAARARAFT